MVWSSPIQWLRGVVMALYIGLGLVGCESETESELDRFVQYDSADVLVSVTPGDSAHAALGWRIDPTPSLTLGSGNDGTEIFHQVQGVTGLSGNRILVVDQGEAPVRIFDVQTGTAVSVGGRGRGPGEFVRPRLIPSPATDSLFISDPGMGRAQVFSEEGDYARGFSLTVEDRHVEGLELGLVGPRLLLFQTGFPGGIDAALQKEGPMDNRNRFLWLDTTVASIIPVDSFPRPRYHVAPQSSPGLFSIPFTTLPSGAVGDRHAWITSGTRPEVRRYGIDGELERINRVDSEPQLVTQQRFDALIEAEASSSSSTPRDLHRRYADVPIPESMPVFEALLVDSQGWLWAKRYEPDTEAPPRWMVFAPDGRARGVVAAPAGLEIHWIGDNSILGVWRDELGVEEVRLHGLVREVG